MICHESGCSDIEHLGVRFCCWRLTARRGLGSAGAAMAQMDEDGNGEVDKAE